MKSCTAPKIQRFYPAEIAPFAFEPLRSDFIVRATDDNRGEGLVALRDFAVGDVVFAFRGDILPEMTLFTLQIAPGRHIEDPYVMGKVLHHCAPNCHVNLASLTFVAIRPIAAGDYVTMDYNQTEDVLFRPFTCHCNAPGCRGRIVGRRPAAQ